MNYEKVVVIDSGKPGKTVAIMGGVHGDETCGVRAVERLIQSPPALLSGQLFLMFGNPAAIAAGKRQTEMNLNRAFRPLEMLTDAQLRTYERQRALELMPYLAECDVLLDIHSVSALVTQPFIICEPNSFSVARRLPFNLRSSGWDILEPGGTDYFVNRSGGMGICVECGFHEDPLAVGRAEEAISAVLCLAGLVPGEMPSLKQQRFLYVHYAHIVREGFVPAREFEDFEPLPGGTLIGHDGAVECRIPMRDGERILFASKPRSRGDEAYLLAREFPE